jgi:hypothetical protein
VDEARARLGARAREHRGRTRVGAPRELGLALAAVDLREAGAVHPDERTRQRASRSRTAPSSATSKSSMSAPLASAPSRASCSSSAEPS